MNFFKGMVRYWVRCYRFSADKLNGYGIELDEVECFTVLEADDGFLPARSLALVGTTLALDFPGNVERADSFYLLAEELFNSALDLELVRIAINLEHVFVVLLLQESCLLADENIVDNLVNVFHGDEIVKWLVCA